MSKTKLQTETWDRHGDPPLSGERVDGGRRVGSSSLRLSVYVSLTYVKGRVETFGNDEFEETGALLRRLVQTKRRRNKIKHLWPTIK